MSNLHPDTFRLSFLCPRYWGIWIGYGLLRLIGWLPYQTKFRVGKTIGRLLYRVAPSRRRLVRKNLTIAFPEKADKDLESLVKEHFESLGISLIETSINLWGDHRKGPNNNQAGTHQHYKGLENLEKAAGQGVLLLVPHFTTLETTGLMLSKITQFRPIYRKHDNALMEYLITKSRTLTSDEGDTVKPLMNTDTRAMIKALKAGEAMMILPDQRYRAKGKVDVPFFGRPAPSNPGICKLAKLGNAKVLPVFTRRIGTDYELNILPGLENFPTGDDYQDVLRLHALYEAEIRANPAQYLWSHNRWSLKKGKDF